MGDPGRQGGMAPTTVWCCWAAGGRSCLHSPLLSGPAGLALQPERTHRASVPDSGASRMFRMPPFSRHTTTAVLAGTST